MKFVPNVVSSKLGRQALLAQKHSPTILFAGGVVGVVATTVLACRATLKLDQVLEDTQKHLNDARNLQHQNYSEHDRQQDMAYIYIRASVKVAKLYSPAILVGAASIGALAGSHNILSKRNAALTAAYAAVEKGLREYHQRVVDEFGEDKARELRYGSEERTVVEETDKGTKKVQVKHVTENGHSPYARFFDEMNKNWNPNPEYNIMFLRCQQNYANDRLRAKGHLLLNDVYDMLGMERTKAGCVVGWVWNDQGDDFVDFGVWEDGNMERVHDFMVGRERAVLLDFNVDGVVYDKI